MNTTEVEGSVPKKAADLEGIESVVDRGVRELFAFAAGPVAEATAPLAPAQEEINTVLEEHGLRMRMVTVIPPGREESYRQMKLSGFMLAEAEAGAGTTRAPAI